MADTRTEGIPAPAYDAVVLAGGTARRLGGTDKLALDVGGRPLLDRVLAAVADAGRVVVVGPTRAVAGPVTWAREEPPGGGPVAGLAAGLRLATAPAVAVLAGDLPFLDASVVRRLRRHACGVDGAVLIDDEGRDQLLAGVWDADGLRAALQRLDGVADQSMRRLVAGCRLHRVSVPSAVGSPQPWLDCDTAEDVALARALAADAG